MTKTFLVIGVWEDDLSRWADSFDAEHAADAEAQAEALYGEGLIIAGVIALNNQGEMEVVA